jgi:heat shock protein 1/8
MGTHDVSLLNMCDGMFTVLATGGHTKLGGEDLDNILVDYCVEEYKKLYHKDLLTNPRAIRRLRTACERAKRTLSSATEATIEIESLLDGQDFMFKLTRAKFENLCMPIFSQTLEPVDRVLQDARMAKKNVNKIVLVGGSTRIPKVQQMLSEYFGGKELCKAVNPDEAVAWGSCIQSAILAGLKDEKLNSLVLLDVTPISLGIETNGCQMTVLIPRNTTIPTKKTQIFSTACDSQTSCEIKVYEGERARTRDNNLLGTFMLSGIPPMPRGMPKIRITYNIDSNGILEVQAEEESSGKKQSITIRNEKGRLSDAEIKRMVEESERLKEEDEQFRKQLEAKNGLEGLVYSVKNSLNDSNGVGAKISASDRDVLNSAVDEMQKWLNEHPNESVAEYESKKKEFESKVHPIMMKMYSSNTTAPNMESGFTSSSSGNKGPTVEEVD